MPERGPGRLTFKERVTPLSHEDRLRVLFTLQHGEPVEIMVQLESWIVGKWTPVRRYDTRHGYLHVHLMPWDSEQDTRQRLTSGLKDALNVAIHNLQVNWSSYREACRRAIEGER